MVPAPPAPARPPKAGPALRACEASGRARKTHELCVTAQMLHRAALHSERNKRPNSPRPPLPRQVRDTRSGAVSPLCTATGNFRKSVDKSVDSHADAIKTPRFQCDAQGLGGSSWNASRWAFSEPKRKKPVERGLFPGRVWRRGSPLFRHLNVSPVNSHQSP